MSESTFFVIHTGTIKGERVTSRAIIPNPGGLCTRHQREQLVAVPATIAMQRRSASHKIELKLCQDCYEEYREWLRKMAQEAGKEEADGDEQTSKDDCE